MHIVYVHRGVYPERIGGTYSYIYELGRRLAARGHQVDVIASTRDAVPPPSYLHEGMRIHKYAFRRVNPVSSTLQHMQKTHAILGEISATSPVDVLSINDTHLGIKAARSQLGRSMCQIPTYHAPVFLEFRLNTAWRISEEPSAARRLVLRATERPLEHWQWRCERGVLEAARGVVVLSKYSRGHIETNFPSVDLSKVRIIPGGVDTDRFRPADDRAAVRSRLGLKPDGLYLVTIRNLYPRMGLENLVDAMAEIRSSDAPEAREIELLIIGDGQLRESLERRITERGVGIAVKLMGRVSHDDLVRSYQAADAFVLPTAAMEGFGIVTVEALSSNLPVLGTNAGATPELLEPIDERLVIPDTTAGAIAESIVSWLRWRREDEGTTRYRDAAVKRFAWDRVTEATERYYEETVAGFTESP